MVEAVTICASDAKMVRLGADYPLFGGRDLARSPACLGHELALRVAEMGEGVPPTLSPGARIGVQPDVYKNGQRSCIGVNLPGGMADAVVLGEAVLQSDDGNLVFPVPPALSRASTALLEPLGCVEGAFRAWGRDLVKPGGRLVVLCAGDPDWILDRPLPSGHIDLVNMDSTAFAEAGGPLHARTSTLDAVLADAQAPDDLLVLGAVDPVAIGAVYDRLSSGGTFIWLADEAVAPHVPVDLAHFHYAKLTQRGARSRRLSDAFLKPIRYDYRAGGCALVFGASGAMGRVHLTRALEAPDGPALLVAVARRSDKLCALVAELAPLAARNGRTLASVALDGNPAWTDQLRGFAPQGFDDVIVVAPGVDAMRQAVPFLGVAGLLIGFAGTRAGETVALPFGRLLADGVNITASSGSTVEDQKRVIARALEGTLSPDLLIAAVAGFPATRDAVAAVMAGRFSGKVLMLPALDWPLMTLDQLFAARPDLEILAGPGRSWSKAIEDAVLGA